MVYFDILCIQLLWGAKGHLGQGYMKNKSLEKFSGGKN